MHDHETTPTPLSASIAALEAEAGYVPGGQQAIETLEREMLDMQGRINAIRMRVFGGQRAQRILDYLREQTERVLAGGELAHERCFGQPEARVVNSTPIRVEFDTESAKAHSATELPEPHELPETLASTPENLNGAAVVMPIESDTDLGKSPLPDRPTTDLPATENVSLGLLASEAQSSEPADAEAAVLPSAPDSLEEPYLSYRERLTEWFETLDADAVITNRSVSIALGMTEKAAGFQLPKLVLDGTLERLPGTGVPGKPSQYRKVTQEPTAHAAPESAQAVAKAEEINPPPSPASKPKPAPVAVIQPNAHLDRDLPPLKEKEGKAGPLECEQVFGVLRRRGRPMSLAMITGRSKGLKQADIEATLSKMQAQGKVERDQDGFWKAL